MSEPIGGVDWVAVQKALHGWVVAGSGLTDQQVVWGQQDSPRPPGPAITMRLSNIAEMNRPWLVMRPNPLLVNALTVTGVDTVGDTLTIPLHGLQTGDGPLVVASTAATPGNLDPAKHYWAIGVDANNLQLADSYAHTGGGQGAGNPTTAVDITSVGSGIITLSGTAGTVRAGAELLGVAQAFLRVTLELHCHSSDGVGLAMATSILQRVRTRRAWQSQVDRLTAAGIGVTDVERVRAVQGVRDALLFEPRAYLDVQLSVVAEESEAVTIIEKVSVENDTFTPHTTVTVEAPES